MVATTGAGTVYYLNGPNFTSDLVVFVLSFFVVWPLHCLVFFDLGLLYKNHMTHCNLISDSSTAVNYIYRQHQYTYFGARSIKLADNPPFAKLVDITAMQRNAIATSRFSHGTNPVATRNTPAPTLPVNSNYRIYILHSNMTSFFRFANKRAIYLEGKIFISTCAVHTFKYGDKITK